MEQYGFIEKVVDNNILQIKKCYQYEEDSLVVAEVSQEIGNQYLQLFLEGNHLTEEVSGKFDDMEETQKEVFQEILQGLECRLLLLFWKYQDEEKLLFLSNTRKVRALEILDYLIGEFGLVRGNIECASGQISSAILGVQISNMEVQDAKEYFLHTVQSYYKDCQWIDAERYGVVRCDEIAKMTKYYKKHIAWAYVKSSDVVPEGEQVRIKSLENESGLLLTASEDTYIMIGCRGEVYDIKKEKFMNTYDETAESLDIFEQMLDFIPAVERVSDGEYISLDEVAKLCYPKRGNGIYARELEQRTKIFPKENQEYYLGRPGDYMAVRLDDFSDIYIIQREIFQQTYEV